MDKTDKNNPKNRGENIVSSVTINLHCFWKSNISQNVEIFKSTISMCKTFHTQSAFLLEIHDLFSYLEE